MSARVTGMGEVLDAASPPIARTADPSLRLLELNRFDAS